MTPFEGRDAQIAAMIRDRIERVKVEAKRCGWHPTSQAWHRAFGQLSGLHQVLELIDRDANDVRPSVKDLA